MGPPFGAAFFVRGCPLTVDAPTAGIHRQFLRLPPQAAEHVEFREVRHVQLGTYGGGINITADSDWMSRSGRFGSALRGARPGSDSGGMIHPGETRRVKFFGIRTNA